MNTVPSPTRRVLGDKNPNAPLQIQSPTKPKHDLATASPVINRPDLKHPRSPSSSMPASPRAGQKRKIIETMDESMVDSQSSTLSNHPLSQMTDLLSDTSSQNVSSPKRSLEQARSTPNTTFTSFQASEEESQNMEAQFMIHEEMSQRTLDKMHAVTLPQNTSQLIPPLRPNLVKEASQVSLSMSSLIDFENDESPEEDDLEYIEAVEPLPKQRPQTEDETRKEMLLEKAETLRTRLQLAIFKVQTNQVTKPFARLHVPKTRSSSPNPPVLSSSPRSSSTIKGSSFEHQTMSPETRVALARARATMESKPVVRTLSSLPVPTILPTAYSARWNEEITQHEHEDSSQEQLADLPSSPPLSQEDATYPTGPSKAQIVEPRTPVQLSSPASSQDGDSQLQIISAAGPKATAQDHRFQHGGLTSSVVKGEAASGLLELMRSSGGSTGGAPSSGGSGMCGL